MPGDFPERPSKAVVREALEFIRDEGEPIRWRGHTHTRPPQDAVVEYLEEFDLPKARHKDKALWAPCPICSPKFGKYCQSGKIAWFPDEGVIRMIGGDCYASLVGTEQHEAALADLRRRQRIARDEAFVVSQVPFVRTNLPTLERIVAYCRAVDAFRDRLLPRMGEQLHSALWRHVSIGGELRTTRAVTERRLAQGRTVERETAQEIRYADLAGYRILRPPDDSRLESKVAAVPTRIRELVDEGGQLLSAPTPDVRRLAIRRLTRAWRVADDVLGDARTLAGFVQPLNINTLRAWAALADSPVSGYFAIQGTNLLAGLDQEGAVAIPIPPELLTEAPVLPSFSDRVALE